MAQYRLRFLYLLTLLVLFRPMVRAADFPPITDEDKNFKEVPGQPGAPAVVLFREELDDDDKNHSQSTYERIKILTEAGRQYADVIIPFYKYQSNIESVSGRTIHADGTIVPFDGKVYDKEMVKAGGFKYHVKTFSLPDVQVGSIIEYRYFFRYADDTSIPPYWIIQGPLWVKKAHYRFDPYEKDLILPHGVIGNGVAWVWNLPPKSGQPKEVHMADGRYYIEFNVDGMEPFIDEPYMPNNDTFKAFIRFFYRVPEFKNGSYWKSEGKYWNKDVEKFIGKKDGINDALAKIIAPTDTPEDKVKKIYDFVGTLENQSYTREKSTQELKALGLKEVRGASDVLQQKSGDRDELTRLFVAMTRSAGIPAYVMAITSREDRFFNENYFSTEQLDVEIAIVQLNGKDVFLDPGSKYCPYGMLDWRHTWTRGMRQSPEGAVLADTPPPVYTDAMTQRVGRFVLSEDGKLEGTLGIGYYGQEALRRRHDALRTDAAGRKKELEDEVKEWLPADSEVTLTSEPKWDTSQGAVIAQFHVVTTPLSNAGKHALLPVLLCQLSEKPKFPASQRVNGMYLYYPWGEVDQISVTVPPNFEVENLPQAENVRLGDALYKTTWTRDKQTISVRRDFAVASFAFPQTRYEEIKGFFDKVKTGDEQQAVLKVNPNVVGQ